MILHAHLLGDKWTLAHSFQTCEAFLIVMCDSKIFHSFFQVTHHSVFTGSIGPDQQSQQKLSGVLVYIQ